MEELFALYAARGFADFAGLTVSGAVPIKEELANELIARFLTAASADGSSAVPSTVPTQALLHLVKTLQVRATEGVVTVHFEIRA